MKHLKSSTMTSRHLNKIKVSILTNSYNKKKELHSENKILPMISKNDLPKIFLFQLLINLFYKSKKLWFTYLSKYDYYFFFPLATDEIFVTTMQYSNKILYIIVQRIETTVAVLIRYCYRICLLLNVDNWDDCFHCISF